jgi:predicted ATPase with chaperone activity
MRVGEIRQFYQLQAEGQRLMRSAMSQLNLSARAYAQHNVIAF